MKIYNTLSRSKQELKPLSDKIFKIYVCGPTVYDFDHLGHARTYLVFDTLNRVLEYLGYKIYYVQNITDVGHIVNDRESGVDKIEKRAKKERKNPEQIAQFYEKAHIDDLKSLNIVLPQKFPRATEHIQDMIKLIQKLISSGHAYEVSGNVYFDISKFKNYGKLSRRKIENFKKTVRIEKDTNKKNPADFALWKKADSSHLQQWNSPWGRGYPGWHIECSVMSTKYLGQPFDIHGSAVEHIFPHHENEIAQSEALEKKPLAKYWVHSGMVNIGGQKMGKSKGNFIYIKDLLKKYPADVIRLAILQTHWHKPLDYKERVFLQAKERYEKLLRQKEGIGDKQPLDFARDRQGTVNKEFQREFTAALEDDLNTPKALEIIDKYLSKLTSEDFELISKILGLEFKISKIKLTAKQKELILKREKLRKEGNFRQADKIRLYLQKDGVIIEDTEKGSRILAPSNPPAGGESRD